MRLIGLSMVKNEGDVIEAYVRHNLGLVDALFIIDNHSVDGTREILVELQREGLPLVIYDDPRPAYFQSEKMTALYRNVCEYTNPDYVFMFDADEFLCAESREALEAKLARLPRGVHGLIPWKTYLCPPSVTPDAAQQNPVERMTHRRSAEHPQYYKVVVSADPVENHHLVVGQGNHSVSHTERGDLPHLHLDGLAIAHFPIRSEPQVITKATCGWLAYLAKDPNAAASDHGYQWRDLYQRMLTNEGIASDELHDISLTYAQQPPSDGAEQGQTPVLEPLPVHYELRYQELSRPRPYEVLARTWEGYLAGATGLNPVPRVRDAAGRGRITSSGAWEAEFHLEHLFLDLPPFRYLADKYQLHSVLDLGCGLGGYIRMFQAWGAEEVCGVDGFPSTDAYLSPGNYVEHDLRTPFDLHRAYDLAICTEVIEHIDERFENVVLDNIAHHARDLILFSAAEPDQPGLGHVNCKPLSHWLECWQARGWQPDPFESLAVRSLSTFLWFRHNLVVLKRGSQRQTASATFTCGDLECLARMPARWYSQEPCIYSFPMSEPLSTAYDDETVTPTCDTLVGSQRNEDDVRNQAERIADLQAQAAQLGIEVEASRAREAEVKAELERLRAAVAARDAWIGHLEHAPPLSVTFRGIRQLVLPLGSRRYALYKQMRGAGRKRGQGAIAGM